MEKKNNNVALIIAIIVIVVLLIVVTYVYLNGWVRLGPEIVSPQGVALSSPLVSGCFCYCSEHETGGGKYVFVIPKPGQSCANLNGVKCDSNGNGVPDGTLWACKQGYGMSF